MRYMGFKTQSEFLNWLEERAKKNILLVLVVEQLIKDKKIEVNEEEMDKTFRQYNIDPKIDQQNVERIKTILSQEILFTTLIEECK
jgi:FKBP-type peptidyl-prolyl cis-trans isomerase (trigger factor)